MLYFMEMDRGVFLSYLTSDAFFSSHRRKNIFGSPSLKIARKRLLSNVLVSLSVSSQWNSILKKIGVFPAKAKLGVE